MLVLPGAGFAPRPMPLEHARHGYLALDIQIHGQEVDLPQYEKLPGYYDRIRYEPPTAHYYHQVHLHCVQAVTYLCSRPDVDPKRIAVVGGSQGGRLGVVLAGLDPRVKALVACITHYANQTYLEWADAANRAKPRLAGMAHAGPPPLADTPKYRCMGYYDVMSFAPDVRCPVLMNAGLIDRVSPPVGIYAVYRLLGTRDKTLVPLPGLAHDWSAEFDRRAWRWLDERLRLDR